jgi:23S rRNA (uracil1939-C5)-methyltransferase
MTELAIKITELSKCGKGQGAVKKDGETLTCQVPFTLPGDVVKLQVNDSRNGVACGTLQKILTPSPLRTLPRCTHFTQCGGCTFQHMPYKAQLLHKEKIIKESFGPLLDESVIVHPMLASNNLWRYRNKMDYTFGYDGAGNCALGNIQAGTKGVVVNIQECFVSPQWFMDALICIKQWWESSKIAAYDPVNNKGILRYLTLREGRRSGDRMVVLTVSSNNEFDLHVRQIEKFVATVVEYVKPHQQDNQLSIVLRIHQASKGCASNQYDMLLYGPGVAREGMKIQLAQDQEPVLLTFEVGSSSFFQPNPQHSELFYSRALAMAGINKESVVYDLYCGAGVLGVCASKFAKRVIGVELSSEIAVNARRNVQLNQCDNMIVYTGAVRHILRAFKDNEEPQPDVVIVNPPRAGLEPLALQNLMELNPPAILYLSSLPSTQAKNIQKLVDGGYRLVEIQPGDQFPQTRHMENVALLRKKK